MMMGELCALLLLSGTGVSFLPGGTIELSDSRLELGHVADLSELPVDMAQQVGRHLVKRLPGKAGAYEISAETLRKWVRSSIPCMDVDHQAETEFYIRVRNADGLQRQAKVSSAICYKAAMALSEFELVSRDKVLKTQCQDKQPASLYFDLSDRVLRSATAIPQSDYLGRIRPEPAGTVDRRTVMNFVYRSGPVTITRKVKALQPSAPGKRALFASEDGKIMIAQYQQETEK